MWCVYILHSRRLNRFYTGSTSDLDVRLDFHRNPQARKFTAKAKDWGVFFQFECESKSQALSIEKHIKKMKSRVYIENLKKYPEMAEKLLLRYKT